MILGIGLSCVDVVIQVDDLFFSRCGLKGKGFSSKVDPNQFQALLEIAQGNPLIMPGGIAANTIRGLASLGEQCAFISCRGEDSFGEILAQNWQSLQILDLAVVLPDYPTARALCLVTPDGRRTILAASKKYNDLLPWSPSDFKNTSLIHLEAYSLAESSYIEKVLELALRENKTVSMSLSSIEAVPQLRGQVLDLLDRYVDIVFANEEEIEALFNLKPEEACFKLQKMCPIVVVTQGEKGCLIGNENQLMSFPAFPASVIDTTGAGDLFASGFLYGYLKAKPIPRCAEIGNFLGSVAVTTMGATLPEEKWQEINTRLK